MKTQVIVPAAGIGMRFKSPVPKPLVLLDGKPIFISTLEVFEDCPSVDSVIVTVCEPHLQDFKGRIKEFNLQKVAYVIAGGATRCDSVENGLKVLDDDTDLVMIHDGVRPLIAPKIVEELISQGQEASAAILAVPVKPTIKSVNQESMSVKETLDRSTLWEVQTPQIFRKDVLIKAHKERRQDNPTDDASLVEELGVEVKVVMGDYKNVKITTEEDLIYAKALQATISEK